MIPTALSTQNKELASKDLHVPLPKKNNIIFESITTGHFLAFHQLPCQENMAIFLNHNHLKILGLIHYQTCCYFHYQMPK